MKLITSIDHLDEVLSDGKFHDFKLCLQHGLFSRKSLRRLQDGTYKVVNWIDDTTELLTREGLRKCSNIAHAIDNEAFVEKTAA